MIRIFHQFEQLIDGTLETVHRLREDLVQAELYRTLADGEENYALVLLAQDEASYASVLAQLDEFPAYRHLLHTPGVSTDIYEQSDYGLVEGKWQPVSPRSGAIYWPARGAVQIIIQGAYEENLDMRKLTANEIAETRREPGCIFYSWFENVELENHLLLLETWADQRIYDLHWSGRMRSIEYRGNSGRVAADMQRGQARREFYRRQQFEYQYGVMMPKNPDEYSESVVWES